MGKIAKRVDDHVGGRIRERRTMMGMTQENLANALQISYQQVQKYETGANRISAGRLYELAQILKVDVNFLFEGLEPTAQQEPMAHGGKNRSTIELVRNFTEIDDSAVRSAVSGLIKTLSLKTRDRERAA